MIFLVPCLFFPVILAPSWGSEFSKKRDLHASKELTDNELLHLASLTDTRHIDRVLDSILVPRVVGSSAHEKVAQYIVDELRALDWQVDLDEFTDVAPKFGKLKFRNIIASPNPNAERHLVLACHYDSKYFENEHFEGASDSAVPCAMMLNLAKVMRKELEGLRSRSDLGLKFVFFDGEEAFVEWGPDDSIYGARHLANKYQRTCKREDTTGEKICDLHRIDLLVLLDLLGPPNPTFYSSFRNTDRWYLRLVNAENRLGNLGLLDRQQSTYFKPQSSRSYVEDDHIPFLKRHVPILHIIPGSFPKSWHTPDDNRDGIDMKTVENLNKIFRVFVAEYLHLSV